jgi:hypothetical protein
MAPPTGAASAVRKKLRREGKRSLFISPPMLKVYGHADSQRDHFPNAIPPPACSGGWMANSIPLPKKVPRVGYSRFPFTMIYFECQNADG